MKTYKERIDKIWEALKIEQQKPEYKILNTHERVVFYCKFMKDCREGEYLIKVAKSNENYVPGYVDFSYRADGWLTTSRREDAQWFSGQEIGEFLQSHRGFCAVKR